MDLIERILEEGKISKNELRKKIDEKKEELLGISETGILRIVAKDLGVNLSRPEVRELKIENIVPNMRNITFIGKVTDILPAREFQSERGNGRVQNVTLEDETGKIRLSLWNDDIEKFGLKIGDAVKIENCTTRMDNLGKPEARLGFNGSLTKTNIEIKTREPKKNISSAFEGDDVSIEAVIIEIFTRPILYDFCPYCRSRTFNGQCQTHGPVQAERTLIVSGVVDDGTGAMPAAFFREQAEKLLGMQTSEVGSKLENKTLDEFAASLGLISKRFKIDGMIRKNNITNELEIRVKNVEEI
ncbi:MAG: hypothetical protein HZB66_03030 [Candidatus Aenigmarchaeota archaeon]|nr:hypothetical protein [Candidatus Aenigmarchaeota archaeon]